jgi:hypothetical protein
MANELCSTQDALPGDFKMFSWATIWPPRNLDQEYQRKLWITVEVYTIYYTYILHTYTY